MKKILEAELMSLAHQILRLKNKSDIQTALMASKKLTEKLSILAFLEEHTLAIKPTLSTFEAQQVVLDIFDDETYPESTEVQEEKTVESIAPAVEKPKKVEPIPVQNVDTSISIPEEVFIPKAKVAAEPIEEEEEEIIEDQPIDSTISLDFDLPSLGELKPKKQKTKSKKSSLDSFLEELEPTPTFVKAETLKEETETQPDNSSISFEKPVVKEEKKISINDRLKKSVTIGLNDKIAFVKHLFDGSNADFVRVISQVNTLDNFEEAKDFIELLVKPDYNNWEGKEEIEERFMHAVENKFS